MARRASIFADSKRFPYPTLVIAGPDEFLADAHASAFLPPASTSFPPATKPAVVPQAPLASLATPILSQSAYNLLNYNAGYLSRKSFQWFANARLQPPKGFKLVEDTPVTCRVTLDGYKIGIVFFPYGKNDRHTPEEKLIKQCLSAGKKLQKSTHLVIGVSPWGLLAEHSFLSKAHGTFDCLLGGGDGVGFSHSVTRDVPDILWLRSDTHGRAITEAEIYDMPSAKGRANWAEGVSFSAKHLYLGAHVPSDPDMQRLLYTPLAQ